MSNIAIAYINYVLPSELKDQTEHEQNKELVLMALDHAVGLSRLLQCVCLDIEASPDEAQRRVDNLVSGIHTAGELLQIICDSAFSKIGEDALSQSPQHQECQKDSPGESDDGAGLPIDA